MPNPPRQPSFAERAVPPLRRRPGRPHATDPSGQDLREHVIAAAERVYAEHGYAGSSVEQILEASGISRPTFYRMFKDRREVIEVLVRRGHDLLRELMFEAVTRQSSVETMVEVAVDAYFEWGRRLGPMARPVFGEIYDSASPVSEGRERILAELVTLVHATAERLGRPRLEPLFYDALLRAAEHIGYTTFGPTHVAPELVQRRRTMIMRILLASLAMPENQASVPPLASVALRD